MLPLTRKRHALRCLASLLAGSPSEAERLCMAVATVLAGLAPALANLPTQVYTGLHYRRARERDRNIPLQPMGVSVPFQQRTLLEAPLLQRR